MTVTEAQLLAIMPYAKTNAERHGKGWFTRLLNYLNSLADEFDINTPQRMAHYLGQIAHETGEFRYMEEIASGEAYEGRKDLGNTQKGDGKKFKGRGCMQMTGRANYTAYKNYCGYDVVAKPYLIAQPKGAMRSGLWCFKRLGCLPYADQNNITMVTKKINGGTNGLSQRTKYTNKALEVLENGE